MTTESQAGWTAESLQRLTDREHVRLRVGMYIGDAGVFGLHNLLFGVISDLIEGGQNDCLTEIDMTVKSDGSCIIEDDGARLSADLDEDDSQSRGRNVSGFERALSHLLISSHSIGLATANFLSSECDAELYRDGRIYQLRFREGLLKTPLSAVGETTKHGLRLRFLPDSGIFGTTSFDWDMLHERLRQYAFLHRELRVRLTDERRGESLTFHYNEGLADALRELTGRKDAAREEIMHFEWAAKACSINVALLFDEEGGEDVASYVNDEATAEGGSHATGLRNGVIRGVAAYADRHRLYGSRPPSNRQLCPGLRAIIAIRAVRPQFSGGTRNRLQDDSIQKAVEVGVAERVDMWLEQHRAAAGVISRFVASR